MHWQEAISQSPKGSAVRVINPVFNTDYKRTILRYRDGSGYVLFSINNKVDFDLSREARNNELEGYTDWEPTK